jgi:aldehyde:ferredoxin oxidoreductase
MRMTEDFKQRKIEELQARIEMLESLVACCYQFAGAHNAPVEWLDVLFNVAHGESVTPEELDALLPYTPKL